MSKPDKPIEKPKGRTDEARGGREAKHDNGVEGARHGSANGASHV